MWIRGSGDGQILLVRHDVHVKRNNGHRQPTQAELNVFETVSLPSGRCTYHVMPCVLLESFSYSMWMWEIRERSKKKTPVGGSKDIFGLN